MKRNFHTEKSQVQSRCSASHSFFFCCYYRNTLNNKVSAAAGNRSNAWMHVMKHRLGIAYLVQSATCYMRPTRLLHHDFPSHDTHNLLLLPILGAFPERSLLPTGSSSPVTTPTRDSPIHLLSLLPRHYRIAQPRTAFHIGTVDLIRTI